MRMWGVNPELLCNKHLLGEHVEMHMFAGTIAKNISIQGYLDNKLVNPIEINDRHDLLVIEMQKRGMNHQSPLQKIDINIIGEIDVQKNINELSKRCKICQGRMNENLFGG
ncbi:MAG: hypothetical protein UR73_C0013G0004 [candidate division WS6 bacterium GW2011_GWF1_35_23]|uniref:Uncharacterized protein n=1 Tax=candidate division WS6 bacterium GW2011_GWF1_35_23 TaxID=1619097 RepID=A0A0G0CND0_9BACT|nr:MAG: hypothetical protein UR73_C0013G0004 [candidate division WS6 bacterium GW2011_GWF1_35_23]